MSSVYQFEQYVIKNQKDIYKHKTELLSYGLKYDTVKAVYTNTFEVLDYDKDKIEWFCKKYDYEFSKFLINEDNPKSIDLSIYGLYSIDKDNYLIYLRKNDLKCYYISIIHNMSNSVVNILDIRESLHKVLVLKEIETDDYLFEIIKYYTDNYDEINNSEFSKSKFFSILNNLIDSFSKEIHLKNRLTKFKYHLIETVKTKNQNSFLCNCVPGFFPETTFSFSGSKIVSSFTGNSVEPRQETKILKYLYNKENIKYIGVYKEPSNYDLFVNNKIKVKKRDDEIEVKIKNIYEKNGSFLEVTVTDGINNFKLANLIQKEKLLKMVLANR